MAKREIFVVHQYNIKDPLHDTVVCPNCGKLAVYGDLINNTGHQACPKCYESLRKRIEYLRENDYEKYAKESHFYALSDQGYKQACEKFGTRHYSDVYNKKK